MYEYSADDVNRKFHNQVCLCETDKVKKDFYYVVYAGDGEFRLYNKLMAPAYKKDIHYSKIKFSYFRFRAGFYPIETGSGFCLAFRLAENRIYHQGLGNGWYLHNVSGASDLFTKLKGTFDNPIYEKTLQQAGALSSLFRLNPDGYIMDIFARKLALVLKADKIVQMLEPCQELDDLLNRNNNYGYVIKR